MERKEESVKGEEVSLKVKVTFTKSSKRHWDVSVKCLYLLTTS